MVMSAATPGAKPSGRRNPPARRTLVLVNGNARRGGEALQPAISRLRAGGLEVAIERPSDRDAAQALIRARRDEIDRLVVCGGDGTIASSAKLAHEMQLPLGIIPMGTANDLARTLGIPEDPVSAAAIIAAGHTRRIDLGTVNGHPFFNVASIGLSADLARNLCKDTKRRYGRFGYAVAAIRALIAARPFTARILNRGEATVVKTLQIAVGNGRHYGGGNIVAERAEIDDGYLDLYSLEVHSVWKLALMMKSFRAGQHGSWKEVRTARCVEFDITTRKPQPVNTDGELVTETPAHFVVHPKAITVFAPPHRPRV